MSTATPRRRKGAAPIVFVIGAVLLVLILVSALAPRAWNAGDAESAATATATAETDSPIVTGRTSTLEDQIIGDEKTGDKVRVHRITVKLPDGGTETWEVPEFTWFTCDVGDTATRAATTELVTCE